MSLFGCKHPLRRLIVAREQTVELVDDDFERVRYHFVCTGCTRDVEIKHVRCIGGVQAFMARGGIRPVRT